MLGSMISKIRKEKHITKVELAKKTGINIGHISHIERGERNPSHKALKSICKAIDTPYQPLAYTYDKEVTDEQKRYKLINHISSNKILAIDSFSSLIDCPSNVGDASIAIKMIDDSMEPVIAKNSYYFVAFNVPLNNKDIGLFKINNKFVVRKFIIRKDKLVLRADNKNYKDIDFDENTTFTIIGKVYCSNS